MRSPVGISAKLDDDNVRMGVVGWEVISCINFSKTNYFQNWSQNVPTVARNPQYGTAMTLGLKTGGTVIKIQGLMVIVYLPHLRIS